MEAVERKIYSLWVLLKIKRIHKDFNAKIKGKLQTKT